MSLNAVHSDSILSWLDTQTTTMSKQMYSLALLVLVVATFGSSAEAVCLCNVTKNGEYCGTELNALGAGNDCPKNQYFCGNSNRGREAVQLVECPQGRECDIKTFSKCG